MNSLMVARAKRVVIIADSSKLGGHAFARICPIERVETLVTDSGRAPETRRRVPRRRRPGHLRLTGSAESRAYAGMVSTAMRYHERGGRA